MNRSEQIAALLDRHIDIGLLSWHVQIEDMESEVFVSPPLVAVFPRRHVLASRRSIRLEDLTGEAFVLFPTSIHSRLLEIIVATCADAGFAPYVAQEAHHLLPCLRSLTPVSALPSLHHGWLTHVRWTSLMCRRETPLVRTTWFLSDAMTALTSLWSVCRPPQRRNNVPRHAGLIGTNLLRSEPDASRNGTTKSSGSFTHLPVTLTGNTRGNPSTSIHAGSSNLSRPFREQRVGARRWADRSSLAIQ
jgi:LysR substrate binding domain